MEAVVSEIQYFCLHDGPGIRTTVFFAGCPLSCRWCHNPECSSPVAFSLPEGSRLKPKQYKPEALLKEALKDLPFYGNSGGVTCSGGEPLIQGDAVFTLLSSCKKEGVSTALETSLYGPWAEIERLIPVTDYWIVDIKPLRPEIHKRFTSVDNEGILSNLKQLLEKAEKVWVRMTIVPGVYSEEDAVLLAKVLSGSSAVERIELIPFHLLGQEKYREMGIPCPYPSQHEPTEAEIDVYRQRFKQFGLPVV